MGEGVPCCALQPMTCASSAAHLSSVQIWDELTPDCAEASQAEARVWDWSPQTGSQYCLMDADVPPDVAHRIAGELVVSRSWPESDAWVEVPSERCDHWECLVRSRHVSRHDAAR